MEDFERLRMRFERPPVAPAAPPGGVREPVVPAPGAHTDLVQTDPHLSKIEVRIGAELRVRTADLPEAVMTAIDRQLTFRNPIHKAMMRRGRVKEGVTRYLRAFYINGEDLIIARGWTSSFIRILQAHRITAIFIDQTCCPAANRFFCFKGSLYGYQMDGVGDVVMRRFGIISGPIGCGKKVMALYLMARFQVPVLVVVRYKWQLYQWATLAGQFLDQGEEIVGIVGDGKAQIDKPLVVGIDKSLYRLADKLAETTGFLIVDRCDQMQLNGFFKVVHRIRSCRMLGLATSPKRDDGLTQLMTAYVGPILHKISMEDVSRELRVTPPVLIVRDTAFDWELRDDYGDMVSALALDEDRNRLILADILAETAAPTNRALVICERQKHMDRLVELLMENHRQAACVHAGTKDPALESLLIRYNKKDLQVICVTARSIERVVSPGIHRLFMASPVAHSAHVAQAVAKVVRKDAEIPARIFDYVDRPAHLKGTFQRRMKVYAAFQVIKIKKGE